MKRSASFLPLALVLCATAGARAQPLDPPVSRPPGTRTRTAAEAARYRTGPDELQPAVRRPPGYAPAGVDEARERLAPLLRLRPDLALDALLPGFEDYRAVEARLERVARLHGDAVRVETIGAPNGLPVRAVTLRGVPAPGAGPRPRVLILGGVHAGTEKAGFEAATRFVERAAADPRLRARFDITVVPLVNPTALVLGARENAHGVDINRTFIDGKWQPESRVLGDYLRGRRFDASIDLHTAGDPGRDGFFLIRGVKDHGLGDRILRALPSAALLDVPGARPGEAVVGPYHLYGVGLAEIPSIKGTSMDLTARLGARYVYTFEAPTRAKPELQVDLTLRFLSSAFANLHRYGRFDGRAPPPRRAEVAPEGLLGRYRRADGTLDWAAVGRERALPEVAGLAHFGLALFLKELAVVAATGERERFEEFFDGLLTTDFYVHYGLFVAGARAGELAYARFLARHVRPRFVRGLLRTNLALAAGLALPAVVDGSFQRRAFAVSLGALFLSSSAVRAGARAIAWVRDLAVARRGGALAAAGFRASAFARAAGWFYRAGELAVVLYLAEELEERAHEFLARREAEDDLAQAGLDLARAAFAPGATADAVARAASDYRAAWGRWRRGLLRPWERSGAELARRVEALGRDAKLLEARRRAARERLVDRPALRAHARRRAGSVEDYAASLVRDDASALDRAVERTFGNAERERAALLAELYPGARRPAPFLAGVRPGDWALAAGPEGVGEGLLGRYRRWRARARLRAALRGAAHDRLGSLADEAEVLAALGKALRDEGRPELARLLEEHAAQARRLLAAEERWARSLDFSGAAGLVGGLERR